MIRVALPARLAPGSLRSALAELRSAEGVRVLVGGEDGFCQGMDLEAASADSADAFDRFAELLTEIRGAPTIAFVDGDARGGGVGLAAACDVVLATPRASFALTELLFGLVPGAILPALTERMTRQKVCRMAMTGLAVDAHEALQLGLVDEVVESDAAIRKWSKALGRAEPGASQVLRHLLDGGFRGAVARGGEATRHCLRQDAAKERIAEFLAGGIPWSV